MTPPKRTETQPVRKDQILAAARKVFREKGIEKATIGDIVREAGIAQGTFYLYFSSKKELLIALIHRFLEIMAQHVHEVYNPFRPFDQRIRMLMRACFESARANADIIQLLFSVPESASVEFQTTFLNNNPVLANLSWMLEQDVQAGNIPPLDPEPTARLIMGLVKTAFVEAFVLGDDEHAQRMEEQAGKLVLNALKGSASR